MTEPVGRARMLLRAGLVVALVAGLSWLWVERAQVRKGWVERPWRMADLARVPNTTAGWPPQLEQPFPDVQLTDHAGRPFGMHDLLGRPVLIEFVAMTCAACQAWSGGGARGAYAGLVSQDDLRSIEAYVSEIAGVDLHGGEVSFVQLVVYDTALQVPDAEALAGWRTHFGLDGYEHSYVVTGGEALANGASFRRIPGFLLLDSRGVVVADALGHRPKHDLYSELLPTLATLARR